MLNIVKKVTVVGLLVAGVSGFSLTAANAGHGPWTKFQLDTWASSVGSGDTGTMTLGSANAAAIALGVVYCASDCDRNDSFSIVLGIGTGGAGSTKSSGDERSYWSDGDATSGFHFGSNGEVNGGVGNNSGEAEVRTSGEGSTFSKGEGSTASASGGAGASAGVVSTPAGTTVAAAGNAGAGSSATSGSGGSANSHSSTSASGSAKAH